MGADKAYMPLRDFKDRFYPGRTWKGDFGKVEQISKVPIEKPVDLEDESRSEASMMIDQIMEGKAIDDILAERDALERKQMVEEEKERRKKLQSLKEEFETGSVASERIDNIISAKTNDPRAMKQTAVSS